MTAFRTTLPLTPEQKSDLYRLDLLIDELRKVNPEMPIQQMKTLVSIAIEQGRTVTDIANGASLGLASTSRHIEALGEPTKKTPKALDLVVADYDVMNRRNKIVTLTPKGATVVKSLLHYMRPTK